MKFGWLLALAALLAAGSALAQDTTTDKGKLSYAIGFQIGSGLADRKMDIDIATVAKALQDAYGKKPPAVPEAAMRDALSKFESKAKADMDKTLADNKREGDAFMAANRSKKGVVVLPGDVQYRVIEDGSGKAVTAASEVTFHIRVSNSSGRELQSSFVGEPVKAKVADMSKMFGPKVPDVVQKMKVGDHWTIYLPPDPNTGNQVLVLEIKIIDVK
ncbi:MAG TPA: FKBP-type peptidyl-prolyl cis-trans isomerase N-terminal domain-containing protein [Rhodanobacteraceae bacterium]|nr:FKBP-type peptidyl-prolyl cis-trans isomerase N-terminal domain-containing protein [Rhodanobacteraceae bacterium]